MQNNTTKKQKIRFPIGQFGPAEAGMTSVQDALPFPRTSQPTEIISVSAWRIQLDQINQCTRHKTSITSCWLNFYKLLPNKQNRTCSCSSCQSTSLHELHPLQDADYDLTLGIPAVVPFQWMLQDLAALGVCHVLAQNTQMPLFSPPGHYPGHAASPVLLPPGRALVSAHDTPRRTLFISQLWNLSLG